MRPNKKLRASRWKTDIKTLGRDPVTACILLTKFAASTASLKTVYRKLWEKNFHLEPVDSGRPSNFGELRLPVIYTRCCLQEFRCLQNTSDNLCGEISLEPD